MIDKLIIKYSKQVDKAKSKEEIKQLVRKIFNDKRLNDIDFNDFIYDYVIPRLHDFNVDLRYDWSTGETNYEKVMKEGY